MAQPQVLLVENKPDGLESLEQTLRGADRQIVRVSSVQVALESLSTQVFAMVLIHAHEPATAFDLAEKIRALNQAETVPIIFISDRLPSSQMTFKGLEAGAVDFLYEPLDERVVRSKVGVFLDLERHRQMLQTQVRHLQAIRQELEQSRAKVVRSNKELERFAYVASHDMKEPLRMITLHLSLLSRDAKLKLEPKHLESLSYAIQSSQRLAGLIDSLISYARFGNAGVERVLFDSKELVDEVTHDLAQTLREKGVRVEVSELPQLYADRVQIRQVFQNLVSNAIKFSPGPNPVVHVSALRSEQEHILRVSDGGIGIDAKQLSKIFDPFVRIHPRQQFEGSGIGLSVCKTIVEKHGGRIWAESEPGKGSTFCFTLPREPNPPVELPGLKP